MLLLNEVHGACGGRGRYRWWMIGGVRKAISRRVFWRAERLLVHRRGGWRSRAWGSRWVWFCQPITAVAGGAVETPCQQLPGRPQPQHPRCPRDQRLVRSTRAIRLNTYLVPGALGGKCVLAVPGLAPASRPPVCLCRGDVVGRPCSIRQAGPRTTTTTPPTCLRRHGAGSSPVCESKAGCCNENPMSSLLGSSAIPFPPSYASCFFHSTSIPKGPSGPAPPSLSRNDSQPIELV